MRIKSYKLFIYVKLKKICATKGQLEATPLLSLTRLRLCTFDCRKPHLERKPINGIGVAIVVLFFFYLVRRNLGYWLFNKPKYPTLKLSRMKQT